MRRNVDSTEQKHYYVAIECRNILGDNGLVVWTGLFGETLDYLSSLYLWTCAKWDNIGLTHYCKGTPNTPLRSPFQSSGAT